MGHPLMYTNVANEMPVVPLPALLPRYKGPWPIAPTCDAIPNTRNSLWRIDCEHVVVLTLRTPVKMEYDLYIT